MRAESLYAALRAASGVPATSAPAIVRYTLESSPQAEGAVGRPRSALVYVLDAKSAGSSSAAAFKSLTIEAYTASSGARGASP